MAYCDKCGAYIPDGRTKCLACGYDSAAKEETPPSGSQAYAYGQAAREERREEYRQEAEEELRRRQERRQRREEYRASAAEEARRRRAQQEEQTWDGSHPYSRQGEVHSQTEYPFTGWGKAGGRSGNRALAALSYLSFLFLLPFLACPDDGFARYHARQGMLLFFFSLVVDALGALIPAGWLVTLFRLYCIVKGIGNALNGRREPLPLIGKFAEKSEP